MSVVDRDWSQISPRSLLGRLLRLPLRLVPPKAVVKVRSGVNKGFLWIAGSSVHGCWLGGYERDKQWAIGRFIHEGQTVFDVGANVGFFTLALSRLVGGGGKVFAFELFEGNVAALRAHLELNGLSNVTLIQAAVADKEGTVDFHLGAHNAMGSLIYEGAETVRVDTVSLDQIIGEGKAGPPDLVKIDVEGAEAMVLTGAKDLLARKKTVFFVALHSEEQANLCSDILHDAGYDLFTLDGQPLVDQRGDLSEIYAVPRP